MERVSQRVAVFIDGNNVTNGLRRNWAGRQINWRKLKENFLNTMGTVVGIFIYFSELVPRTQDEESETRLVGWRRFLSFLQREGYRVFKKEASEVYEAREVVGYKGNCDVEIAVDMTSLVATGRVDQVVLMSGDRDFVYLAEKMRSCPYGIRFIVVGFQGSTADALKNACDEFIAIDTIIAPLLNPVTNGT